MLPQARFWLTDKKHKSRIKLEEQQAAEAKGKQEERLTIARTMLAKGLDVTLIADITGLSHEEIGKLKEHR